MMPKDNMLLLEVSGTINNKTDGNKILKFLHLHMRMGFFWLSDVYALEGTNLKVTSPVIIWLFSNESYLYLDTIQFAYKV